MFINTYLFYGFSSIKYGGSKGYIINSKLAEKFETRTGRVPITYIE